MSPAEQFRPIVVPTDFSVAAERAWSVAQRLARALRAELVLVHVLPPPASSAPDRAAEAAHRWAADELEDSAGQARAQGLRARAALRTGAPPQEIVAVAREEDADLIVLAVGARPAADRPTLGDVAAQVFRRAPCPVVMVPETAGAAAAQPAGAAGKVSTNVVPCPTSD